MLVLSHRCVAGGREEEEEGGWLDWGGFWQTQCVTPPQIRPPADELTGVEWLRGAGSD